MSNLHLARLLRVMEYFSWTPRSKKKEALTSGERSTLTTSGMLSAAPSVPWSCVPDKQTIQTKGSAAHTSVRLGLTDFFFFFFFNMSWPQFDMLDSETCLCFQGAVF